MSSLTDPEAGLKPVTWVDPALLSDANQPVTDEARFYRDTVTNHYARAMHEASADGAAYGFAFDDVAGHAAYIQDNPPTSITVTLTPF
jgi:hypothetical protein